jgi:exopolysaccharide biosynthesis polyprenyl glycosylphosphotransferase
MFNIRVYLTNASLACFDVAVTAVCYFAVRPFGIAASARQTEGLFAHDPFVAALALIAWIALSSYFGMYRSRRMDSPLADVIVVLKVGLASWVLLQAVFSLFPAPGFSALGYGRFVGANILALTLARSALRVALRELRRRGYNVKQLLVIATEEIGDRLEQKISRRCHYGYRIAARLVYGGSSSVEDGGLLARVDELLRKRKIDDVILALPAHANVLCARLVSECESQGVSVRIVPDLVPIIRTDTQVYDLDGIPLVNAHLYPTESLRYIVIKRCFDVCLSLLVLTLLSPLFLLLSLLIKVTSPGPVFFMQDRVGMNGRRFRIIKFRTMHQAPSLDPDSHWTVHNDRYITPVGRWLRRTNLDELPQFLNVLKGEMSVVGPRPERPFFLERFRREVPEYMARHYVKSGITGWAQVNGWRGDTPIPQRVEHDLYYIRHWAVSFDIKILLLTLARTLFPGSTGLQRE